MIPCIVESPFKGANRAEEQRNRAYLDKLIRRCVHLGYTPYASHKMLTDALDDSDPEERERGIKAGLAMSLCVLKAHPDAQIFFGIDYGMSEGMSKYAEPFYIDNGFEARIEKVEVGKL